VFPLLTLTQVSTTVFQTFQYDERLNDGTAYLVADYSIQKDDPVHQDYVIYAALMVVVYCFGIPAASWFALYSKREQIKKLQEELAPNADGVAANKSPNENQRGELQDIDPWLVGLSPLYKDYGSEHWWFEVSRCFIFFSHPVSLYHPWSMISLPLFPADSQVHSHFDFVRPCDLDSCGGSIASFYFACDVDEYDDTVCKQQPVLERQR
jgi:hypothetical protein